MKRNAALSESQANANIAMVAVDRDKTAIHDVISMLVANAGGKNGLAFKSFTFGKDDGGMFLHLQPSDNPSTPDGKELPPAEPGGAA